MFFELSNEFLLQLSSISFVIALAKIYLWRQWNHSFDKFDWNYKNNHFRAVLPTIDYLNTDQIENIKKWITLKVRRKEAPEDDDADYSLSPFHIFNKGNGEIMNGKRTCIHCIQKI